MTAEGAAADPLPLPPSGYGGAWRRVIAACDRVDGVLAVIADRSVWLLVALMAVICLDVVTRKFGIYIPGLRSTRLQELEWHLHAALFALWLGFGYLVNAHPRVDSVYERLDLRGRAWVEFAGCLLFALPYCTVFVYWGVPFLLASFAIGETSESVGGVPFRWFIKGVFVLGLVLLLVAVISTTFRLAAYLFGGVAARQARLPIDPDKG